MKPLSLPDAHIDPVVLALAVALGSRRPVATLFDGGASVSAPVDRATTISVGRPQMASSRTPRSKNRKG